MSGRKASRKNRKQPAAPNPLLSERTCLVLLAVVIVFFSLIRFRLRNVPLERDEGEYAYAGQLLLQGIPPYKLAYNMKLPGTYAAYALIMAIFGQSPAAIHAGLILVNGVTVVLLYFLAKKLFDPLAGLAAGASFALLACSETVLGLAAHATHFVVLAAVAGLLLLLRAVQNGRMRELFLAGLLLGTAFVLKQPGLFFGLFGAVFLIAYEFRESGEWRRIAQHFLYYTAGVVIPFAVVCVAMYLWGSFAKMWFWTFDYGRQYASVVTPSQGLANFLIALPAVTAPCLPIWIFAVVGLALVWEHRFRKHLIFLVGLLLFSFLAVCPGLYFRGHYFILWLPAISLFAGVAVSGLTGEVSKRTQNRFALAIPAFALIGAFIFSLANQYDLLFVADALSVCRAVYGGNPFPEAVAVSEFIRKHSKSDATIAVLGSEPEIYFYSNRHSATGYIYAYPLTEPQKYAADMQKDMASEIERAQPEYIVLVKIHISWLATPESSTHILDWVTRYAAENYELVGVADEVEPDTAYVWGDAAKTYRERSPSVLQVFKRIR